MLDDSDAMPVGTMLPLGRGSEKLGTMLGTMV
jgi:hypothetical protein